MNSVTLALSEDVIKTAFKAFVATFKFKNADMTGGSARVGYDFAGHLLGGSLELVDPDAHMPWHQDGFINLKRLQVVWDRFMFTLELDLPRTCTPSFCLIPDLIHGGCLVWAEQKCLFGGHPDLHGSIDLSPNGLIHSAFSAGFGPMTVRGHAKDNPNQPEWHIVPNFVYIDPQLIDVADTVKGLLDALIKNIIDNAYPKDFPKWARDLIDAILGGIANVVYWMLRIGPDLRVWLETQLRTSLNIAGVIGQSLQGYFRDDLVLFRLDDPHTIMPDVAADHNQPALPCVRLPIAGISGTVVNRELVVNIQL